MLAPALLALALAGAPEPAREGEARISLDVKDADVVDIVRVLAEVAGFQVVFDPGVSCRLTLKLKEVRWPAALDLALKSCGLGRDEEGGIIRVATVARLTEESAARRRLEEERQAAPAAAARRVSTFRLSHARAAEMAPLVKKMLPPRAEVVYDVRTNTLIIID